ncbi:DUF397 domain-containing protein [Frankia umida]|uniref:DUF397 domain-containing protein n=1 Tax=Frankia umida TaxID=573489 RepID=UPI0027E57B05|nr:DUF397 domain-containing protein [Frankia umida]
MTPKIEFDRDSLVWKLSSHTNGSGACVEVAVLPQDGRALRDSKDRTGPILVFTAAEWAAFTSGHPRRRVRQLTAIGILADLMSLRQAAPAARWAPP